MNKKLLKFMWKLLIFLAGIFGLSIVILIFIKNHCLDLKQKILFISSLYISIMGFIGINEVDN